jgi:hypothetical protein
MFQKTIWLAALLLGWSCVTYAQVGACPPGTIPNGNQYNAMSCAPAQNYNQQQQDAPPPPVWVDQWGASAGAMPGDPPAFGAAANMPSKAAAEAAALSKCEEATLNTKCGVDYVYHNSCLAITWGDKVTMNYTAATLTEAKYLSMESCKAHGNKQCIPYYSACSYPIRLQ